MSLRTGSEFSESEWPLHLAWAQELGNAGWIGLESVSEWLTWLAGSEQEYTEKLLEPDRLAMTAVVELRGSKQIVGDLMITIEDRGPRPRSAQQVSRKQVEIGYCLDPAYTGHGYDTEEVREVLRYCVEDLAVHRIVANCFADNGTSWRLMERIGMRREIHAIADSMHRSGEWHDSYGYAVPVSTSPPYGTTPSNKDPASPRPHPSDAPRHRVPRPHPLPAPVRQHSGAGPAGGWIDDGLTSHVGTDQESIYLAHGALAPRATF